MYTIIQIIIGVAFITALALLIRRLVKIYVRYRGKMVVTCPENQQPAGVEVDARYAAVTATMEGENLVLKTCTRWPEMHDCGQECLAQIENAPEDCKVRNILDHWFEDRSCIFCHKHFGHTHWHDHKPVLMNPEKSFREWNDIPVEKLPDFLKTHEAVCWDCFIAETFRRQHPELVTDRPANREHLIK